MCLGTVGMLGTTQARPRGGESAPYTTLPSLGGNSEAHGINEAGTVIAGQSFDRHGLLHAVTWTLQSDGSWTLTNLPWPSGASSTIARGVNNFGDAAGNDFPSAVSRAVLWPGTGGLNVLGCDPDLGPARVYAISPDTQVVVGAGGLSSSRPSVWRPGGCREDLPGVSGVAFAVNGDGTQVGGSVNISGSYVPVRWKTIGGAWQMEQLDSRAGLAVGANNGGDFAGRVIVPCTLTDGCDRAVIWYAAGGSQELGTLGGEDSVANDINASGEVVGMSTSPMVVGETAFFWSASGGMVQLPFRGRFAVANALSDVRPDGTRLVVGANSKAEAIVWVVRNP
jgi:uncharacterized membrane protein